MQQKEVYEELFCDADYEILTTYPFSIRGKTAHRKLKLYPNKKGPRVNINGCKYYLHHLIAMQFIDNPHHYKFVRHINGNNDDYRIENLEWGRINQI